MTIRKTLLTLVTSLSFAACYTLPEQPAQPRGPDEEEEEQEPPPDTMQDPQVNPSDRTPPTVDVAYPEEGMQVSGTVNIRVNASDDVRVARVKIFVGGEERVALDAPPFEYEWDTAGGTGRIAIKAVAIDAGGNDTTDDDTSVEVTTGGGGGGPTGDPAAASRAYFVSNIAPVLMAKCSAEICHGGTATSPLKFLPASIDDYYNLVTGYQDRVVGYFDKTRAPVLKQIQTGMHYATAYTPDEEAKLISWLDMELAWRSNTGNPNPNPTGPTPGEISDQLIAEWSGCMDLATWTAENVAEEWAYLNSGEGPCIRCHINGQASFIATDDNQRMFDVLTQNRYFMLSYFVPNVLDLANPKMEINVSSFQRVGDALYPHLQHPQFDEAGDAMLALQRFYDATMQRKTAGTCGPSRIVQ